ncbi:MAG: hypothetical protein PHW10_01225 [Candidatus Peribacteraceae bacterium]|nr:hypothetical protein [Candidatus Peribacteraceae bacterium]
MDQEFLQFAASLALASNQQDSDMRLGIEERNLILNSLPGILCDDDPQRRKMLETAVLTGRNDRSEAFLAAASVTRFMRKGLYGATDEELLQFLLHPEQWTQVLEAIVSADHRCLVHADWPIRR